MPPNGRWKEMFKKVPDTDYSEMVFDGPDWETHDTLLGSFNERVDIDFVYVNPLTERIEDDDRLNIAPRVWIEAGGWHDQSGDKNLPVPEEGWNKHNKWIGCHDYRLDCGGPDLETAILELACRVEFYYGDGHENKLNVPVKCEGFFKNAVEFTGYTSTCTADTEGYCIKCGFLVKEDN
jgi:hypothetical protein